MAGAMEIIDDVELPFTEGTLFYCVDINGRAVQDLVDPCNTYQPLEPRNVRIKDARPIRDKLDLDKQGFMLLDHKSSVSHLRNKAEIEETYNSELIKLIQDLSGADLVLPYLQLFVRFSKNASVIAKDETEKPSAYVHMDFTTKSFWDNVGWVQDAAGIERQKYSRVVLYQTWRAVSEPPQDFPLTLTDSRSIKPGNYVIMDNIIGPQEIDGNVVETRLGRVGLHDSWYYFSNMRADELILFKGYDTNVGESLNVLHTSFDATAGQSHFIPRESIEARFFAFWR